MKYISIEFWLIRHAAIDIKGKYIGHTDAGIIEPKTLLIDAAQHLNNAHAWHTSDLQRSTETAKWICDTLKISRTFKISPQLREQSFGAWEGKTYDEVFAQHPNLNWNEPAIMQPDNGESFAQLCMRVNEWQEQQFHTHSPQNIVVAHAGSIRAILAHALSLTPTQALNFRIDNGSISYVKYYTPQAGCATVEYINRALFV